MLVFEVGSLVCAVAQNPTTLIVGRAIAGVGGSGVTVGLFTIVGFAAPPEKRPQFLGMVGATYAIAAVLGPLIGGAFTDKVTWRWVAESLFLCEAALLTSSQCFYINLPIGGLAAIITFFFFKPPTSAKPAQATLKEKLLQLDLVGAALMMSLLISYILALQYGGQTHPWNSSVIIGLLVGFVAILAVFIVWEMYQKEYAMIVPRLVSCASADGLLRKGRTLTMMPVYGTLHLDRLILPDLLQRLLFRHTLLPSHLLSERPRRQSNRIRCQNARLDHSPHVCRHRTRICVH